MMTTTNDSHPLLAKKNSIGYRGIEPQDPLPQQQSQHESLATDSQDQHKTTVYQTFVHLLKGYMGAGCLSLPWAISQLGFTWGPFAIVSVSVWSSYNCWTIVKLKRFIEKETPDIDEKASEASSVTTNTQVTYAAVGEFFYGTKFETYVAACVCTQQLAICTVFISFVGENILAVFQSLGITFMATHAGVMTLELPFLMGLSLIPNLKRLSPVMAIGTFLLIVTFCAIGVIIQQEWKNRPLDPIEVNWLSAPLAVCAILYSYEGINLILPVESAMSQPQHFQGPFMLAMMCVAIILASFSIICVLTFGNVTSGSVTAFLIQAYPDDPAILWWLMVANAAVSMSVLLTYPLQLFPAVELLAPWFSRVFSPPEDPKMDQDDLSAFEPLPPLPEHDVPEYEQGDQEHHYNATGEEVPKVEDKEETNSIAFSAVTSMHSIFPEMTMPGDSPLFRSILVLVTYMIAVVVPNVQALISLAGALAGSSSALLIPPMLELAWIKHLESSSTVTPQQETQGNFNRNGGGGVLLTRNCSMEKVKCYFLLLLGFLFFLIGTSASLADIVRIYVQ